MGVTLFKKGGGSTPSFKTTTTETRRLTLFGVKLAEELSDWYNAEHTLHGLRCATALMEVFQLAQQCSFAYRKMDFLRINYESVSSRGFVMPWRYFTFIFSYNTLNKPSLVIFVEFRQLRLFET